MRSVADDLDREGRAALRKLTIAERVALALALGERDVETLRTAQGLSREEAVRLIQRQRQSGRRPSACMRALVG